MNKNAHLKKNKINKNPKGNLLNVPNIGKRESQKDNNFLKVNKNDLSMISTHSAVLKSKAVPQSKYKNQLLSSFENKSDAKSHLSNSMMMGPALYREN